MSIDIQIIHVAEHRCINMSSAGGYETSGMLTINGVRHRYYAEKFDTNGYSGGLDITLYLTGDDDEVVREIEWDDYEDEREWEQICERIEELTDDLDGTIWQAMDVAKAAAIAEINASKAP